jgi:hypothetical protein
MVHSLAYNAAEAGAKGNYDRLGYQWQLGRVIIAPTSISDAGFEEVRSDNVVTYPTN